MSIILILPIAFGLISGLAINYMADVLPNTRKFTQPTCHQCGTPFSWWGYFLFQQCSNGHKRSFRNWVVIFIMLVTSIFIWLNPPSKLGYWLAYLLITYFGLVFVIDMEHRLILHPTSIAGSILALTVGLVSHTVSETLIGGLAGFLIMLALYYFGIVFSKFRANRMRAQGIEADDEEALGGGDVILGAILGLALGWPLIWFSLLLGIFAAGFFGLFLMGFMVIVRKYKENALMIFMPYGPFMILSAFFIIFLPSLVLQIVPK